MHCNSADHEIGGYQFLRKSVTMSQDSNLPISSLRVDKPCTSQDSNLPINSVQFETPSILPPQNFPEKPTLVLDLDGTLVHSTVQYIPEIFDFFVQYEIGNKLVTQYVLKRPGLNEFLEKLSAKYELVIFTAGLRESASHVVDQIDPRGLISHRLFRDSCKQIDGKFVKDLGEIGRELKKLVLVDDNPDAFILHPENAILVPTFLDDLEDMLLEKLGKFLEEWSGVEDMREAVSVSPVMDDDSVLRIIV